VHLRLCFGGRGLGGGRGVNRGGSPLAQGYHRCGKKVKWLDGGREGGCHISRRRKRRRRKKRRKKRRRKRRERRKEMTQTMARREETGKYLETHIKTTCLLLNSDHMVQLTQHIILDNYST